MKLRMYISLIAPIILISCATVSEQPASPQEIDAAVDRQFDCAFPKLKSLDDGISPANVIARSVVMACASETNAVVDAYSRGHDISFKNMLREKMFSGDMFIDNVAAMRASRK